MIPLGSIEGATIARAALRLMNVSTAPLVERSLRSLLDFARDGRGPNPADHLRRVIYELALPPVARADAFDPMTVPLKLIEGLAGETDRGQLVAVVLAARGRVRLGWGLVQVGELAALAGCSTRHVRHLVESGTLLRVPSAGPRGPIGSDKAVPFLRARGVRPWALPLRSG